VKKVNIVKKNWEFQKIIERKQNFINSSAVVYFIKTNNNYSRFGISVSKKFGNAVFRNKYKRITRAIIDELNLISIKGYDFVIILRKNFFLLNHKQKINKLSNLFKKVDR